MKERGAWKKRIEWQWNAASAAARVSIMATKRTFYKEFSYTIRANSNVAVTKFQINFFSVAVFLSIANLDTHVGVYFYIVYVAKAKALREFGLYRRVFVNPGAGGVIWRMIEWARDESTFGELFPIKRIRIAEGIFHDTNESSTNGFFFIQN